MTIKDQVEAGEALLAWERRRQASRAIGGCIGHVIVLSLNGLVVYLLLHNLPLDFAGALIFTMLLDHLIQIKAKMLK